jgi:hypothetical protein
LATSVVSLLKNTQITSHGAGPEERWRKEQENRSAIYLVTALTVVALLIHGYHPFAEDGGLYLAGIKRVLEPGMYPLESGFVLGHLRFSVFAPVLALVVRISGAKLETILLLLYLGAIWTTLWAGWLIARRCFQGRGRVGAVALLATWLTMPIAGTSLMLMDPYVTARSISTPCTMLALVYAFDFLSQWHRYGELDREAMAKLGIALAIAALMHPLMAAYGFGCVLALGVAVTRRRRTWLIGMAALCVSAIAVATILRMVGQPESESYRQVAMSRYYWFLKEWHWYEWIGLAGPLVILGYTAFGLRRKNHSPAQIALARMCIVAGTAAGLVALIFARPDATNLLVARLQPLRVFQIIYIVMILFVGAQLTTWFGDKKLLRTITFAALAAIMFTAERETFPSSAHIELPMERQNNEWVQAFEWIRNNTPKGALFALDADYITKPGEDAQSFRAIAERSVLPDYSKDGGEAAITPSLADSWKAGQFLQSRLSERTDGDRIASLKPAGVNWVVLSRKAVTAFRCDYANAAVKVCRLPANDAGKNVASAASPLLPAKR